MGAIEQRLQTGMEEIVEPKVSNLRAFEHSWKLLFAR